MMDINYGAVREQIKATPARSAWRRGVSAYALELLDSVAGCAAYEGHGHCRAAMHTLRAAQDSRRRAQPELSGVLAGCPGPRPVLRGLRCHHRLQGGASMSANEIAAKVQELRELRRMADELAAEIDSLQDAIKQHMDAAGVDTLAGLDYKITYKAVTSSRLDSKALKADQPDLYAKYTKQTTARRFCFA